MKKNVLPLFLIVFAAGGLCLAQSYGQSPQSGTQALTITHGPVIEQVTDKQAVVAWTTNVPSSAVVHYGTTPKSLTQTAEQSWGGQQNANRTDTHRVTIKGLQPNTTYYIQVESGQAQGSGTGEKSPVVTIHTTAPGAAPESYPNGR
ncbi:MAG: fibronectin type III domain-containing protein [Acidobacteria bacterium]|nr:fibronectin type III domain-containing protein [Acidobacteriota bacterium]